MWVVCAGALSDRVGCKNMFMFGCVFMGVFGFVYFAMLNTGIPWVIFLVIALSLLQVMTQYGPVAALIAESFTLRLRNSGNLLGYQLASIIAGGPSPFIATWLFATFYLVWPIADLYCDLFRYRYRRHGDVDRLHEQEHFGRLCRGMTATVLL